MHWAYETPSLRQELSDCRGFHLSEVLASVNATEVTQVPGEVQLIRDDGETCCLLHVELGSRHEVARGQEVLHSLTDCCLAVDKFLEVQRVPDGVDLEFWVLQVLD